MKHKTAIISLMLFAALYPIMLEAQYKNNEITEASMQREGNRMNTNISFDFSGIKVKSNQASVFVPMIVNTNDTVKLDGIAIYGRTRWYQSERSGEKPISGKGELSLRYSDDMEDVALNQSVEYKDWMNGAELLIIRTDYGCAGCNIGNRTLSNLASYREVKYQPAFIFQEAETETIKVRELSGRAYVDFPVNQIKIYPEYRNNTYELGKITATIDSIKNDKDITVTSLHIQGTASPEGPYENNVYLAKNRTEALKDFVQTLYNFPAGFITTSYEPVDWAGLKEWLETHDIDHKEGIMSIISLDIQPYARNSKIRLDYPVQYDWLLKNVYPSLRHSDYRIEYKIRRFSDVEEIAEIFKTAPQKLSLNEMYILARSLQPGSEAYNEVFETAVRMYPNDETANLNAANSSMQRGDLLAAEKFLKKSGKSAEAVYANGVLACLQGEYTKGLKLIEKAVSMGLAVDQGIITNVQEVIKYTE